MILTFLAIFAHAQACANEAFSVHEQIHALSAAEHQPWQQEL